MSPRIPKSAAASPTLRRNLLGDLRRPGKTEEPNPSEAACGLYTELQTKRNVNYLKLFTNKILK